MPVDFASGTIDLDTEDLVVRDGEEENRVPLAEIDAVQAKQGAAGTATISVAVRGETPREYSQCHPIYQVDELMSSIQRVRPGIKTGWGITVVDQRPRQLLFNRVADLVKQGYQVITTTESYAQLVKPKQFNTLLAVLLFLFTWFLLWIPLYIYLIYFWRKKNEVITLRMENGQLIENKA